MYHAVLCRIINAFPHVLKMMILISKPFKQLELTNSIYFRMFSLPYGSRQANLVLIAYASSEGSGEPAHLRSFDRTSIAHSYKQ